jgi:hypothetical protein
MRAVAPPHLRKLSYVTATWAAAARCSRLRSGAARVARGIGASFSSSSSAVKASLVTGEVDVAGSAFLRASIADARRDLMGAAAPGDALDCRHPRDTWRSAGVPWNSRTQALWIRTRDFLAIAAPMFTTSRLGGLSTTRSYSCHVAIRNSESSVRRMHERTALTGQTDCEAGNCGPPATGAASVYGEICWRRYSRRFIVT